MEFASSKSIRFFVRERNENAPARRNRSQGELHEGCQIGVSRKTRRIKALLECLFTNQRILEGFPQVHLQRFGGLRALHFSKYISVRAYTNSGILVFGFF